MRTNPTAAPMLERIVTHATESFLWRLDDYPFERGRWNIHPEYEIHLIRHACGVAFVGDHIGHCGPGYLAIVGGGLPHHWTADVPPGQTVPGREIVIQFDAQRVLQAAAILPELANLDGFLTAARRGLHFYGATALRGAALIEAMGTVVGAARLGLFFQLLGLLSKMQDYDVLASPGFLANVDQAGTDPTGADQAGLDKFQQALAYIFEQYATDLRLPMVARRVGMSDTAFSRFFKKHSGNSFTDHLAKLRIGQACRLLAETDRPITEICFEAGYLNISNFNRCFHRLRRMTPSAYRKLARQRDRRAHESIDSSALPALAALPPVT